MSPPVSSPADHRRGEGVLPIYEVETPLLQALAQDGRVVLAAPTGAGKTTQVPQILLRTGLVDGQIVVLQPRRLATRLVARRVAAELGSPLGKLVGYQTRHESCLGPETRIRFMTYGLFVHLLATGEGLERMSALLLDEFHERHLEADMALALAAREQAARPGLKLAVMSATLDTGLVSSYLGCPVVTSRDRAFPVAVRYAAADHEKRPVWDLAASALWRLVEREPEGDVLVFMPGFHEIRRTIDRIRESPKAAGLALFPLHGELPIEEQDRAVEPGRGRKVIVSTNVAETSITIEGIRHVIDAGLERQLRHDPRRGLNMLVLQKISKSSAEQRAGRAGRTAPGTCVRLWSKHEHAGRSEHGQPEIRRLDLSQAVLQLKGIGLEALHEFAWLEPPPPAALARSEELLVMLGALEPSGKLTKSGALMARLPMHPRLSRLLLEAARTGRPDEACLWAALLSERDVFRKGGAGRFAEVLEGEPGSDVELAARAVTRARELRFEPASCEPIGLDAPACRQVARTAELFRRQARSELWSARRDTGAAASESAAAATLPACLLSAFPDQVAVPRGSEASLYLMTGARKARLAPDSIVERGGLLVAAEATEVEGKEGMILHLGLACPLPVADVVQGRPEAVSRSSELLWNPERRAVESVTRTAYVDLVLEERRSPPAKAELDRASALLAERIRAEGLELTCWNRKVTDWIDRVRCVAEWFPEKGLLDYDEEDLGVIVQEICSGATRYNQVKDRPCYEAVRDALPWREQRFVEEMAPERIKLPRGFAMRIEYRPGERPRGRAKIQDLYGLERSPCVAGGRQPVLLEILAPSMRPVQTTDDLAGFWKNLYPEIRRQLSRRYPKHEWK